MIKIEKTDVFGWEAAVRGLRNPMNSWDKIDSGYCNTLSALNKEGCDICPIKDSDPSICYEKNPYIIGPNDLDLMNRLRNAGTDHRKFMRMIVVYVDITAPLYWWKEFDTYKVGTVANSCSTMHKIHAKEFTLDDFSYEHLVSEYNTEKYFEPHYDESIADIRPISGFSDYEVSEYGTVYSCKSGERKVLKQSVDIDGYKTVGLYTNGVCKRIKVHRLVASTFIPIAKGKDCVNHKDGNKWNNAKDNLEWCTRSENSKHASENKLLTYGSKQRIGKAKQRRFTKQQVEQIKELYFSEGVSQRRIGKMFGCDHSVISEIVNEKIYKDITVYPLEILEIIIDELNRLRDAYLESGDKSYWYSMIQLLPSSYNQKRTVMLNYEVLANIYKSRRNHKLDEWSLTSFDESNKLPNDEFVFGFCDWIKTLPYSELITGRGDEE